MSWNYLYTPYIWPGLATAAFDAALCLYSWRHRRVPGATAFAFYLAAAAAWSVFDALQLASADLPTKLLWAKFAGSAKLLLPVTGLCFALEYAGLGRWLTRRNLALLTLPILVAILLAFTNEANHLTWSSVAFGQRLALGRGSAFLPTLLYSYLLYLLAMAVFVWLFVRSPLHRWPVAIILIGQLAPRGAFIVDVQGVNPLYPLDLSMVLGNVAAAGYAIALFRFRLFDVVPVGRETVLERMVDGMLVLDAQGRVADLNPAAQELLGTVRGRVLGRDGAVVLSDFPDLARLARDPGPAQVDVLLGTSGTQRWYQASGSPLKNRQGFQLGRLILFHDLTEIKLAQQRMLEQQWAQATLEERAQLARELHDGLSQSLGFLNLQAQTAQVYLETGQAQAVSAGLARLAEVSRGLQGDVRELIGNLLAVSLPSEGFCGAVREAAKRFTEQTGLAVCVDVDSATEAACGTPMLPPAVGVQLLRIVQEALTNVRKHAGEPSRVSMRLRADGTLLYLTVTDDGAGFDPTLQKDGDQHYGLRVMRQRAERVGGQLGVDSAPGQGTQVEVSVPLVAEARAERVAAQ